MQRDNSGAIEKGKKRKIFRRCCGIVKEEILTLFLENIADSMEFALIQSKAEYTTDAERNGRNGIHMKVVLF